MRWRRNASTDAAIGGLTIDVAGLQVELADKQQELDQLLRDWAVAPNTYLTLSNEVQETRIETKDEKGNAVWLLSHGALPEKPPSPHRALNTMIAGACGLVLGIASTFSLEYWRHESPQAVPSSGPSPLAL